MVGMLHMLRDVSVFSLTERVGRGGQVCVCACVCVHVFVLIIGLVFVIFNDEVHMCSQKT